MSWGWEHILFLVIALFACGLVLAARTESRTLTVLVCLCVLVPVAGSLAGWSPKAPSFPDANTPQKIDDQGYVSSDACRACHVSEYASWSKSYHRTMTQVATPDAIAAPHESVSLVGNGRSFEVEFEGGAMWTEDIHPYAAMDHLAATVDVLPGPNFVSRAKEMLPPNLRKLRSRVVMTTGSHHMQIYWHRDPKGAFRHLSWVWLIRDRRWVPGESVYLQPPEGVMGLTGQWETNCIKCHSVGGQPRIDRSTRSKTPRESKVGELGIACEGCHGPAKEHIEANRNPARRYALHLQDQDDPTIVHPGKVNSKRSSDICGRCHSGHQHQAWNPITGTPFKAGDALEDYFDLRQYETQPPEERSGYFWDDGTARVTGREYSAMIRSACYLKGELSCGSCHSMHDSDPDDQLSTDRESNASCLGCHPSFEEKLAEHTHHGAESSGSQCMNCHMPNTTYGLLSMTRSHRIDNPSVAMSALDGRPNACNLCHVDQTLAWAGEHLERWYGQDAPVLSEEEEQVPAAALWLLKGDAAQRATAAWHLGWEPVRDRAYSSGQAPLLARSLDDPYAAIRYLAERSLRTFPNFQDFDYDFVAKGTSQGPAVIAALMRAADATGSSSQRLSDAEIERLRSERDNTPISFQE